MKTFDDIHLALREGTVDGELLWDVEEVIHHWLTKKHHGIAEDWPAGIEPIDVDAQLIDDLHTSLVRFVRENLSHPHAGLAIWAIGKLVWASDEPLFAAAVEHGLRGDDNLVYQAVIALDNLKALPGDVTSFSGHEVEANRKIAREYLKHRGE
jgi:hypothetical protein